MKYHCKFAGLDSRKHPQLKFEDNFKQIVSTILRQITSVQSLYNTPCYSVDLDITQSFCGSQIIFTMEFYNHGHFPIILCKIVPL